MGCGKSSQGGQGDSATTKGEEDGPCGSHGDTENGDHKEKGHTANGDHKVDDKPRAPRKDPGLRAPDLQQLLATAGASEEQLQFFEAWCRTVFDEAAPLSPPRGQTLVFSTDLSSLQLQVSGDANAMLGLARKFLGECEVPDTMMQEVEQLQSVVQADEVTLWCKLQQIGKGTPSIDAGATLNGTLEWPTADLLMPWVDDTDTLRAYTTQERHVPSAYGCSLFPKQPERFVKFEMYGEEGPSEGKDKKKNSLLACFFFFKSLGFAKPEDNVVRWLNHCNPMRFTTCVSMGPHGLTRLSMILGDPSEQIAEELASCVDCPYNSRHLAAIKKLVGGRDFDIIEYGAVAGGYALYVGYLA